MMGENVRIDKSMGSNFQWDAKKKNRTIQHTLDLDNHKISIYSALIYSSQ